MASVFILFHFILSALNTRRAEKQRALAVEPLDPANSKQTLTAARERERKKEERVNKPTISTVWSVRVRVPAPPPRFHTFFLCRFGRI